MAAPPPQAAQDVLSIILIKKLPQSTPALERPARKAYVVLVAL